ncbi:MAG: alpha-galactosidase [Bryobacterales bacterium]|nr:alpha-galactosidase [Bryobacterales bacterium]
MAELNQSGVSLRASRLRGAGRLAVLIFPLAWLLNAGVRHDPASHSWILTSGPAEYRLRQDDQAVRLEYFGPAGKPSWRMTTGRQAPPSPASDVAGMVEGRPVAPETLELLSHQIRTVRDGVEELRLLFQQRGLPLEIEIRYATWGDTGVMTRHVLLANRGRAALRIESFPELSWQLPRGEYELTYLWGGWGQERQVASESLQASRRSLVSQRGRSTSLYSPWFALHNRTLGVRYAAQLAWSGNWSMDFERLPGAARTPLRETPLDVRLGSLFDFGGALTLASGASRALPEVAFTTSAGDLDDAANQLHRYQRAYVFPPRPGGEPLLVQFNSWYPFPGKMTVAEMKRSAGIAAGLGAEVFVLDAGWYNRKDWSRELGDYEVDRTAFPNGLEELAQHVRGRGMKFGLWVEIENLGVDSRMFREHPDWCLHYDGKPVLRGARYMLDFARPEVRRWAHAVIHRLVSGYGLEWIKIDYNIDIGSEFGPAAFDRPGSVLFDHIVNYYQWLDEVRAAHPGVLIENCSSGGLRFDLGIMAHTHTTWLSDVVAPVPSLQLAYGCTLEFAPQVCNHWMVGDGERGEVKPESPPEWWDFMFRVPMNGQFGISSRVFDWSADLTRRAAENVKLYKRIRPVIDEADVYHLTPPPPNQSPEGWMALQYAAPGGRRSVLLAYRLARSPAERVFRLRGLDPSARYRVIRDGSSAETLPASRLAGQGLTVRVEREWGAVVIELEAAP